MVSSLILRKIFHLTLFFPMFSFDPPESIRKTGFLMFSGGSKGDTGKERVKMNK